MSCKPDSQASSDDTLPDMLPSKLLVSQENSQKFGLISKTVTNCGIFHLVKPVDEPDSCSSSLSDINCKLNQLLHNQQLIQKALLGQNQLMASKMDSLRRTVRELE